VKITKKLWESLKKELKDNYIVFTKTGNHLKIDELIFTEDKNDDISSVWEKDAEIFFKDSNTYNSFIHDASKLAHLFVLDGKEYFWFKKDI
jgi:uncharacterized cupredoxin-like copper-binding protein